MDITSLHVSNVVFLPHTSDSRLTMRKHQTNPRLGNFLQETKPVLLTTAKVKENKESLRNCHKPELETRQLHTMQDPGTESRVKSGVRFIASEAATSVSQP